MTAFYSVKSVKLFTNYIFSYHLIIRNKRKAEKDLKWK